MDENFYDRSNPATVIAPVTPIQAGASPDALTQLGLEQEQASSGESFQRGLAARGLAVPLAPPPAIPTNLARPPEAPNAFQQALAARGMTASPDESVVRPPNTAPPVDPRAQAIANLRRQGVGSGGGGGGLGMRLPYPDAEKRAYETSFDDVAGAERAHASAQAARNTALAEQAQANLVAAQERMQHREAERAKADEHVIAQTRKAEAIADQVRNRGEYDQGAFFRSPGGIMMAIGAALGGGAAARVTGRNEGMVALNGALDRDFASWRANADKAQKGVDNQNNIVSMYRAAYADRNEADLRAEVAHRQMAIDKMAAMAQRADNPVILATAEKNIALLRQDQAEAQTKVNAMVRQSYAAAAGAQAAARQRAFDNALKLEELGIKRTEAAGKADEAGLKTLGQESESDKADALLETALSRTRAAMEAKGSSGKLAGAAADWAYNKSPAAFGVVMPEASAVFQQEKANAAMMARKKITGAGGSESEADMIRDAFLGAKDDASLSRAMSLYEQGIKAARDRKLAAVSPQVRDKYLRALDTLKRPAEPKGK